MTPPAKRVSYTLSMPISTFLAALGLLASPQPNSAFDKALVGSFTASGTPGSVVAVFKNDQLIFCRTFGIENEATKSPMRDDLAFEIGSLSKQFTAVVLLTLVRDGKLSLSDKLGDIIPDLPEGWRIATVEQTLHHMSGIPDYEAIAGYDFYNKEREPQEIIASASSKPMDFAPGEKYNYSNTGYYLLSMVAEKKGGKSLNDLLVERIFRPLNMTDTYAGNLPSRKTTPVGYHSRSGKRAPQPRIAWSSTLGAGGIVSTVRDLGKWDASLYTEKILPANLRDKMWESTKTTRGEEVNYGFGWVMGTYRGVARQNHSGQTNGFTCYYNRFPSLHYSVIAFTNTYDGDIFAMSGLAMAHFAPELSYLSLPVPPDPEPTATERSMKALRQAAFAEGEMSLLRPGIKDFATKADFAKDRDEIKGFLNETTSFKFLKKTMRKSSTGQDVEEYFYRHDFKGGQVFWTLRFIEGLLGGMNWELE